MKAEQERLKHEEEARELLKLVEERRRQQVESEKKKNNKKPAAVEPSKPKDMEGVDNYPLIRTMNEQERAHLPAQKRKQPTKMSDSDGQIPVEQDGDEDVLMHGRPEVWQPFPFFGRKKQPAADDDDDDSL